MCCATSTSARTSSWAARVSPRRPVSAAARCTRLARLRAAGGLCLYLPLHACHRDRLAASLSGVVGCARTLRKGWRAVQPAEAALFLLHWRCARPHLLRAAAAREQCLRRPRYVHAPRASAAQSWHLPSSACVLARWHACVSSSRSSTACGGASLGVLARDVAAGLALTSKNSRRRRHGHAESVRVQGHSALQSMRAVRSMQNATGL